MMERIQELSAIAKNLATDEAMHLSRVHNRTLSLDEEQEIFTEKFAELVIRDVVNFVGAQRNDIPACGFEFEAAIKQHFGVKE